MCKVSDGLELMHITRKICGGNVTAQAVKKGYSRYSSKVYNMDPRLQVFSGLST